MKSNFILEVHDLRILFKGEKQWNLAVDGLDFKLSRGETLGIVGESGSGKSVSCMALIGLLNPNSSRVTGEILFHELNDETTTLNRLNAEQIRHYRGAELAMIFQEPMTSLNPVYTCGEQVAETIRLHRKVSKEVARSQTIKLFDEVQLPDPPYIFGAYPHQLSGGQKQRVMIAMALSCDPQILIADEPTTALDVTVQKTILDLLKKLQAERGMSMIFVSHDLGIIADIADSVLVMYRGKMVEQGPAIQVFTRPLHPYTKGLLACRPVNNQGLKKLPVISDFMEVLPDGTLVEKTESIDQVKAALAFHPGEKEMRTERIYDAPPLLVIENLSKWYPRPGGWFKPAAKPLKAVDDISFTVFAGETLGLVGESGSGKTTLGRSLLRLIEPNAGKIIYQQQDLIKLDRLAMRAMRRKMQIIFQDPYSSLNPRQTIGDTILEPMKVFGLKENDTQRRKRVYELLERVNLQADHFNRYPHEFSGGQRQRIGIARTLALEPEFIICDESVSALDVSVQAQILNLLISLREEFNLTYIFISHDLSVVRFIADRIIVLNQGKIEEIGTPETIYNNPLTEYTRKLINAIPGR